MWSGLVARRFASMSLNTRSMSPAARPAASAIADAGTASFRAYRQRSRAWYGTEK